MSFIIIGGKLPSIAFQTVAGDASAATTYTFTSQPIGTADSSRYVIVSAMLSMAGSSGATLGCTIGGTAGTNISGATHTFVTGAADICFGMWRRNVTSGTTANIVVTTSVSAANCHIGVWSIYDTRDAGAPFASTFGSTTGATLNLNVNTDTNGVGCGLVLNAANVTWTGATEDYDALIAGKWMSGASFSSAAAATPRAVSLTSGTSSHYGNFASFR